MADVLERRYRSGAGPVLVTGPEFLASKLRLLTGGRIPIDTWNRLDPVRDHWRDAFVLPAADAASLDLMGYRSQVIATEVRSVPVAGLLEAILRGRVRTFLEVRRERFVLATRA